MREIKFRGRRVDNGEWVYGYYSDVPGPNIMFWKPIGEIDEVESFEMDAESVVPDSAGQFTGLKDKNGKDIYEGDIIRSTISMEEYFDIVVWDNDDGCWKFENIHGHCIVRWDDIDRESVEVVGNDFERGSS